MHQGGSKRNYFTRFMHWQYDIVLATYCVCFASFLWLSLNLAISSTDAHNLDPSDEESTLLLRGVDVDEEERLMIDKFRGYNSLVRPVQNRTSPPIQVALGMAMILLINMDEKNQIMQTNVWLTLSWHDYLMKWNPKDYGGIRSFRVPPSKVWVPDIVLFNNADGRYEVSYQSNVVITYDGTMLWVPPAIYKSSCKINVEFFPFDEQNCSMLFGSWTYNADEVHLTWYNNKRAVELNDYSYSGIWDIMDVPGRIINHSLIEFRISIRRKTLFYTVILIIPTVLMAFLSMMVFYLPADCSEKITLAISILLALVVFLLLVSKILPPTSTTIPLMARYLLMVFVTNIISILVTVVIINVYFRSPATHTMPKWMRVFFLKLMPRLLVMRRPKPIPLWNGFFPEDYDATVGEAVEQSIVLPAVQASMAPFLGMASLSQKKSRDDWKYMAMVIDRLVLYIFFGVTVGGTCTILLSSPNVFEYVDQAKVIAYLSEKYSTMPPQQG